MTTIRVKDNEPFDVALRRFKRTIEKLGLLTDLLPASFMKSQPLSASVRRLLPSSVTTSVSAQCNSRKSCTKTVPASRPAQPA